MDKNRLAFLFISLGLRLDIMDNAVESCSNFSRQRNGILARSDAIIWLVSTLVIREENLNSVLSQRFFQKRKLCMVVIVLCMLRIG